MSILSRTISLIGSRGRTDRVALFDSGADYSMIRRDIAEAIAEPIALPDPENWIFETARAGDEIHATHRITLDFRFYDSDARFSDEFIVFDDAAEEVIIGTATMQKWRIGLDFENEQIVYRKTARRLRV